MYASGRHGRDYVNMDALYLYPRKASLVGEALASKFLEFGLHADIVVAPAMAGIIPAQWMAYHLNDSKGPAVLSAYAEKNGDGFVFRRGYGDLIGALRVFVLDAVWNTGGSARKVIELVLELGGDLVGAGAICNRGGVKRQDLGLGDAHAFFSLAEIAGESWHENHCPLCRDGVPVRTDLGHGKVFLKKRCMA